MAEAKSKDWFGHPKGLAVLAGTEVWERFSFFGMQALLMLFIKLPTNLKMVLQVALL